MSKKQEICAVIAAIEFILAAGLIDKQPGITLILIVAMVVPAVIGKLEKRRITTEDIERRCRDVEN